MNFTNGKINMNRVLITGANSYIGDSVRDYLLSQPDKQYIVDVIDTIGLDPTPELFAAYDIVFNVAGIVHIKETADNRHLYFDINRDLIVKIAKAAKAGGVKQFILLSTMSVYGITTGHITKDTMPNPDSAYGQSKLEADLEIGLLSDESFRFVCIRPPMVYGKGCKGNYQKLREFALKSPVFPNYNNKRSMIFIGNLCEFIKIIIDEQRFGLFFPQNEQYVSTSDMVRCIALENNKKIILTKAFNWLIKSIHSSVFKKVFGSLTYETSDIISKYSFHESIELTER